MMFSEAGFCIKKMFQNGAIRLDLVRLSWIKLDFLRPPANAGLSQDHCDWLRLRATRLRRDGYGAASPV